jgi:predicted acylesterase/phospholipase RssA
MAPYALEARALATPEDLVAAILASSAFPPFTPVARILGRVALDGGLVESVPLGLLSGGERVALLTLPRPRQPLPPSVRVIAPAEPLDVAMWDYASVTRITRVYDQGRRAGEALAGRAFF